MTAVAVTKDAALADKNLALETIDEVVLAVNCNP